MCNRVIHFPSAFSDGEVAVETGREGHPWLLHVWLQINAPPGSSAIETTVRYKLSSESWVCPRVSIKRDVPYTALSMPKLSQLASLNSEE